MLWLEPDGKCAVVDHSRTTIPLPSVIVPFYPQPGDMISVKGDQDEIWHAECRQVDLKPKRVKGYACQSTPSATYRKIRLLFSVIDNKRGTLEKIKISLWSSIFQVKIEKYNFLVCFDSE